VRKLRAMAWGCGAGMWLYREGSGLRFCWKFGETLERQGTILIKSVSTAHIGRSGKIE
jgi:hypothetical protein